MTPRAVDNPALGGRCLVIDGATVTVDELLAQGLSEAAARELVAFAEKLRAKHASK